MNYAFRNGKILDGTKEMKIQQGLCILVENGIITDLIPDANADLHNYKVIDLHEQYILPGLINMHVHLAGNGKPQKKQRDNEKLVKTIMSSSLTRTIAYKMVAGFAKDELFSGVTTIRTVGGLGNFDTRLRDEIESGTKLGPRILAANQGISVPGGHMAGSVAVAASTIPDALKQLEKAKQEKVDLIKLMITGGVLDAKKKGVPGELKMSPEMVYAVCKQAHDAGYLVAAHVESPEGVRVALENGVDSIEHGAKLDNSMIRLFQERGAFCVQQSHQRFHMRCSTVQSPMQPKSSNIMETSSSRALLTVRKLHSQMTFLLFWAMMLVAHGLPNMISGVNSIIFINMLAYPIPLPSILQQSEVLNLPELVTLPDRSKKEKALT